MSFSLSRPPDAKKHNFYNICSPHLRVSHPCYLIRLHKRRGRTGWRWGLTSQGRAMVISDAPVGADLSRGPQAMWPDKPLAPESAVVGRTQLAPDRPPCSPAQPPQHSQEPAGSCHADLSSRGHCHLLPLQHTHRARDSFFFVKAKIMVKIYTAPQKSQKYAQRLENHQGCSPRIHTGENVNEKGPRLKEGLVWPLGERKGMEIPKHT